jgi:hypothetical protein
MADVASEYRRVQTAYAQPTLRLITWPTSVAVVTILRLMFSVEKPTVPTARMHDQVDVLLADMRREGLANVPTGNGRDACLKWMSDGWLLRIRHPWASTLDRLEEDLSEPVAWRRRFLAATEPVSLADLRMVALRMRGLGPARIASGLGRRSTPTRQPIARTSLALRSALRTLAPPARGGSTETR